MASTKTEICNLALSLIGNEGVQISDFDTDTGKAARQCRLHYQPTLDELIRMHTWNTCKGRTRLCTSEIVDYPTTITVSGTGTAADTTWNFKAVVDGRATYDYTGGGASLIDYQTDKWVMELASTGDTWENTDTSTQVPKCGWGVSDLATAAPSIAYELDFGWERKASLPTDCIRPLHLTRTDSAYHYLKPIDEWTVEGREVFTNNDEAWLLYVKEPTLTEMDPLFTKAFYTLLAIKLVVPLAGPEKVTLQNKMEENFYGFILPEARRVNGFEGREVPVSDSEWLEATYTSPSTLGQSWPPFAESSYGTFNW